MEDENEIHFGIRQTHRPIFTSNVHKKIIIIGNSGSGKTWLATRIAVIFGMPHIALDDIFWEPGGYNLKRKDLEIETDLKRIQESKFWVVEGVFGHLVDQLVSFGDMLIYLNLPWEECRKNLLNRGSESSRQLDPRKAEENFNALLEWASKYGNRSGKASKRYHRLLFNGFWGEKYRVCNRDEIDQLLEKISSIKANSADAKSCAVD